MNFAEKEVNMMDEYATKRDLFQVNMTAAELTHKSIKIARISQVWNFINTLLIVALCILLAVISQ